MEVPGELGYAFKSGVLKPDVHLRLVQDLPAIAAAAGITPDMVYEPAETYLKGQAELSYLRRIKFGERSGLVWVDTPPAGSPVDIGSRMQAVVGACLRNFINAKFVPMGTLLTWVKKEAYPSPSVLCVPDFFCGKKEGSGLAEWQTHGLLSMLYERQGRGLQTFLFVKNTKELGLSYGPAFAKLIESHYEKVKL